MHVWGCVCGSCAVGWGARRGGVVHGDGDAVEDGGNDDGLPQRAVALLEQRQDETLVEGAGLKHRLLDGLEERKVQTAVLPNVVAHNVEKDQVQEALHLLGGQLGHEHLGGHERGVGGPCLWGGHEKDLFPVAHVRNDLECLRHLACRVPAVPTHVRVQGAVDGRAYGPGGDSAGRCGSSRAVRSEQA